MNDMIADAAGKAEHHARASVTSNELQLFAAMAMQGMLANRSNVGMGPDKAGGMAAEARRGAGYGETDAGPKKSAEPNQKSNPAHASHLAR